jgi:hypothetical protein
LFAILRDSLDLDTVKFKVHRVTRGLLGNKYDEDGEAFIDQVWLYSHANTSVL